MSRCEPGDVAFIYGLFDPRTHELRYVGVTFGTVGHHYWDTNLCLERRQLAHCYDVKNRRKWLWVKELRTVDLRPAIRLLETVPYEIGYRAERAWISELLEWGVDLLNAGESNARRREWLLKRPSNKR